VRRLDAIVCLGCFICLCTGASPAGSQSKTPQRNHASSADDVVVTGIRDIVVNGRAIRCRPRAGDPLDDVDLSMTTVSDPHSGGLIFPHMTIIPDAHGAYALVANHEQITGPDYWQRVGAGMDRYVFRGSAPGKPMCIGGRSDRNTFAGFRRIVDAAPFRGKRLRFTAWVASARAGQISFWLAAGTAWREKKRSVERTPSNALLNGGSTDNVPFGGDHGWTPVLLETGPIQKDADHISYGFNLQGSGDIWVYQPKLDIVVAYNGDGKDRIVFGQDRARAASFTPPRPARSAPAPPPAHAPWRR